MRRACHRPNLKVLLFKLTTPPPTRLRSSAVTENRSGSYEAGPCSFGARVGDFSDHAGSGWKHTEIPQRCIHGEDRAVQAAIQAFVRNAKRRQVFYGLLEFLLGVLLRGQMLVPVLRGEAGLLRQGVLGPEIQIALRRSVGVPRSRHGDRGAETTTGGRSLGSQGLDPGHTMPKFS